VRGGSRARAQSPPESPGTLSKKKNKTQRTKVVLIVFILCSLFVVLLDGPTHAGCARYSVIALGAIFDEPSGGLFESTEMVQR
jgi:hypothetical protein